MIVAGSWPARAETLLDALGHAYLNNPTLQAERARLRAIDEQVPQAVAGLYPSVSTTSYAQRQWTVNHSGEQSSANNTKRIGLDITQPIYRGGRINAAIQGAENRVLAARANLLSVEQTTLLSAIIAYIDVLRDRKSLDLIIDYQHILQNRLELERRRLAIGENTKTDVSQAEARLAGAISDRLQAEGTLRASASDYLRLIGNPPTSLSPPKVTVNVPNELDQIIEAVHADNPDIALARFSELSARNDIDVVDGELLPALDAVGSLGRTWGLSSSADTSGSESVIDSATVMLRITVPIDNGSIAARARSSRQTLGQQIAQTEAAQRLAVDRATKSWNYIGSIRAQIQAREIMIKSIMNTLTNLRAEVNIGTRSVTDLLNSEQEALSSYLALNSAKHDELLWLFTLTSSIGRLTAQKLNIPVEYYDHEKHYNMVRNKIWGISLTGDPK